MSFQEEILIRKCPQCGAPLDREGVCPQCQGPSQGQGCGEGQWTVCRPPSADTDCDCPVVGYAKIHAPWCKYC